ncbi:MAG: ribonuclease P protein component [Acidimicrobiales bacterium]
MSSSTSIVKIQSVGDRDTFTKLACSKHRARAGCIGVKYFALPPEQRVFMFSFSIPKSVGGAVKRNRIRRRLRSVLREMSSGMPSGAYLISVRENVSTMKYTKLAEIVAGVIGRATAAR